MTERENNNVVRYSCLLFGVLIVSCMTDADANGNAATQARALVQPEAVPDDPEVNEILAIPGVRLISSLDQTEKRPARMSDAEFASLRTSDSGPKAAVQSTGPRVLVATAKGSYLLEFSEAELNGQFHDIFSTDETAPEGNSKGRGWSNGMDNRGGSAAAVHRHGQVIGQNGDCSGALIGSRIVRTAAHCVVQNSNTSGGVTPTANGQTFRYRQNGATSQVNSASQTVIIGGNYIPSNCGRSMAGNNWWGYNNSLDACTWADWAYIILPANWNGGSYYEWYGYRMLGAGDSSLRLNSLEHRSH